MGILVNENTRLLVQGLGRDGTFQANSCRAYGTNMVAGVHPRRGGTKFEDEVPIFETVTEAVEATGANVGLIFVPASGAADAIIEQVDSGLPLVVCISEGVPVQDMVKTLAYMEGKSSRLLGPNCPGLIHPGTRAKVGIIPGSILSEGRVGVVSRSGTLTYEAVVQLTELGIGQSTCVGIGGDPLHGTTFVDVLEMFENDDETDAIVMIGEIGGTKEQQAAEFISNHVTKPVVGRSSAKQRLPASAWGTPGRSSQGRRHSPLKRSGCSGKRACMWQIRRR